MIGKIGSFAIMDSSSSWMAFNSARVTFVLTQLRILRLLFVSLYQEVLDHSSSEKGRDIVSKIKYRTYMQTSGP